MQSIGCWSWSADPTRLVDPSWAAGEREALANYLRAGRTYAAYFGFSFCRFQCGIPNNGSRDLTDGTWLWPEGLSHYVLVHKIALPDEFLAHARMNGFTIPPTTSESLDAHDKSEIISDEVWHRLARQRRACPLDG